MPQNVQVFFPASTLFRHLEPIYKRQKSHLQINLVKKKKKKGTLLKMWTQDCNLLYYQFSITTFIQNHILRLDVSVENALTVKKGQGLNNTSRVEPGAAFVQMPSETVCRSVWTKHVVRVIETDVRHRTPVGLRNCSEMKAWLKTKWWDCRYCFSIMTWRASHLDFL